MASASQCNPRSWLRFGVYHMVSGGWFGEQGCWRFPPWAAASLACPGWQTRATLNELVQSPAAGFALGRVIWYKVVGLGSRFMAVGRAVWQWERNSVEVSVWSVSGRVAPRSLRFVSRNIREGGVRGRAFGPAMYFFSSEKLLTVRG